MPTKTPETHVIRLGNPVVHEPVVKKGQIVGHLPRKELGQMVLGVQLPHVDAAPLIDNVSHLADAIESRGREQFLIHLLTNTYTGAEDWEVSARHMLAVTSAHARAGIDWVNSGDDALDEALGILLNATLGEHDLYGMDTYGLESRELADMIERARITPEELREYIQAEAKRWPALLKALDHDCGLQALKTTAGVDIVAGNVFGESATVAQVNFLALTANNTAESSASSSLAEEITTAGGGLIRKKSTYAHTTGTSTATLSATFTANGTDALPVTVNKFGGFNKATSGGTMGLETKITATTFNASGDNVTLTDTLTIT